MSESSAERKTDWVPTFREILPVFLREFFPIAMLLLMAAGVIAYLQIDRQKGLCCTNQFKAEFPLTPDGFMA